MARAVPHRNVPVAIPAEDWRRIERYAAQQKISKQVIMYRQVEPLLQLLREIESQQEREDLQEG